MAKPPEDISPPVKPEESPHKTSWLVRIGISLVVLLCGLAGLSLLMGYLYGQERARSAKRSDSVRILSEAVTLYEQSYRIAMTDLPDWKQSLMDSGYITQEVFENSEGVNGKINYILLSRPSIQFKIRHPLWIAVYEDHQSLKRRGINVRAKFQGQGYAAGWNLDELVRRVQEKCQEHGVPFDPATAHLPIPDQTPPKNQNPPP